jgi:hypothetical protein
MDPNPTPFPPCSEIVGDLVGCCEMTPAQPNVSAWIVCADPAIPGPSVAVVPTVSDAGLFVTAALIAAAGIALVSKVRA